MQQNLKKEHPKLGIFSNIPTQPQNPLPIFFVKKMKDPLP